MVEKIRKPAKRWKRRHSQEAILRLAEGQSAPMLAEIMDFNVDTVRNHIQAEQLNHVSDDDRLAAIALQLELSRLRLELLDAESGSAVQARLRASFATLSKMGSEKLEEEAGMMTKQKLGEMSDDELRAYVASLVPGLEVKAANRDDGGRGVSDERVSVSDDGADRAEAAKAGGKLA